MPQCHRDQAAALPSRLQTSTSVTASGTVRVRLCHSGCLSDSDGPQPPGVSRVTAVTWSETPSPSRSIGLQVGADCWAVSNRGYRAGQACPVGPSLSGGLRGSPGSGGVRAGPAVWPGRSTLRVLTVIRCSRTDIEGKKQQIWKIRGKSSATSLKNHGKKVRCSTVVLLLSASYYFLVKVCFFPGLDSCDACFDMYRSLFLPIRLINHDSKTMIGIYGSYAFAARVPLD